MKSGFKIKELILFNLFIILGYYLGSKIGFFLAFLNSQVSPIWPPEGVALASLFILGKSAIPGIFLGAVLSNFLNNPHLETAFLIGMGNTLGSILNYFLVIKIIGSVHIFDRSWSLFKFFVFCTIPGSLLSAFVGASSLYIFGFVKEEVFWNILLTWFSGEMQGFIIVAPFIYVWISYKTLEANFHKTMEMIFILIFISLSAILAFSEKYPISYLPLPFILWGAFRFGRHSGTIAILILSGIAIDRTVNGVGPFAVYSKNTLLLNDSLILLDSYIGAVTVITFFLITLLREKEEAQLSLYLSMKEIEKIKDRVNKELEAKVEERTRIIENQKKELEHQIELAGIIQESLLPSEIPKIENLNIAVKFQPMMKLGGDFFDIKFDKSTNSIGIFLCDVSGHGVPAAFLAAIVKMSLTYWYENIAKLTKSFDYIYKSVKDKLGKNFISASLVHINLNTGELTTARAGHYPLLIVKKTGNSFYLQSKGRVINNTLSPHSEEVKYQLEIGDRIFIYTDGMIEAKHLENRSMFTEDRMLGKILMLKDKSIQELSDEIFNSVLEHSGGKENMDDDVTFIGIEY